jgi:hypothetical protein
MKSAATAFLVLLLSATCAGQAHTDWIKYVSAEGRYSILFPGKPELTTQEAPAHTGEKLKQYFAIYDDPDPAIDIDYSVSYFDLLPGMTYSFDEARDGFLKSVNAKLQSEKPIQLGAYAGREVNASATVKGIDLMLMGKFYIVEKRVYLLQIVLTRPGDTPATKEKTAKFFNSFALAASH